jgi:hypothetical protein
VEPGGGIVGRSPRGSVKPLRRGPGDDCLPRPSGPAPPFEEIIVEKMQPPARFVEEAWVRIALDAIPDFMPGGRS